MIRTWLARRARRQDLANQFRSITGDDLDEETRALLEDEQWGETTLELLKMGTPTEDLTTAILAARHVASVAHCSPMYAAQFVANVRIFTENCMAAPMLAQYLKPEVSQ